VYALVLSAVTTLLGAQEPLRGQVWVDLEPMPGQYADDPGQLDIQSIRRRALEEASLSVEISDWATIKQAALEDAAREAIRAMLRAGERNRPKEATGFISLAAFPSFHMDAGQWAAVGRFRVNITEIIPFAAY
jgi:hypothetical protein